MLFDEGVDLLLKDVVLNGMQLLAFDREFFLGLVEAFIVLDMPQMNVVVLLLSESPVVSLFLSRWIFHQLLLQVLLLWNILMLDS